MTCYADRCELHCRAAPLGTHENGLYRSWGFPYGSETANLISTQFKVTFCCHSHLRTRRCPEHQVDEQRAKAIQPWV